ncbi:unnamed protein product [Rhizoctonia solani]|uniref:Uncharacterized protein n=1 Tax=Rhizoctonia solani TaxID=456999 RepID=A0A8H3CPW0_9AGAM|nr:unnamed protein product [Rhizoctonia solani]
MFDNISPVTLSTSANLPYSSKSGEQTPPNTLFARENTSPPRPNHDTHVSFCPASLIPPSSINMPSLVAHSPLVSAFSALKAKFRTCKDNVASLRTRSSSSSDKRRSMDGERRHVPGLGYIQADVAPRRCRGAAAEAKYGNRTARNQIAQASEITTIGGFAYDRVGADTGVCVSPRSTPRYR